MAVNQSPIALNLNLREPEIGNIVKTMASCLETNKKLTNHSMRKTLVSKLKKSGQPRNVIAEITGHASLHDCDAIDETQRKELSYHQWIKPDHQNNEKEMSNQASKSNPDSNHSLLVRSTTVSSYTVPAAKQHLSP